MSRWYRFSVFCCLQVDEQMVPGLMVGERIHRKREMSHSAPT